MSRQFENVKIDVDSLLMPPPPQHSSQADSTEVPVQASLQDVLAHDKIARLEARNEVLERKTREAGAGALAFLKLGSVALSLSLAVVVNDRHDIMQKIGDAISPDTTTQEEAAQVVSDFRPLPPTDNFFSGIRTVFATTEDDSPAWLANPFADTYSTVVDTLKIRHEAPLVTQVVHDPELGAVLPGYEYLVVISSADTSVDSLQYMPVLPVHQPLAPERCWLADNSENGHIAFEGCLDHGDESFSGQMTTYASDGGLLNDDDQMLEKAEAVASLAAHNNFCTIMGIFSDAYDYWDPASRTFQLDVNAIDRSDVYRKMKNIYYGSLRRQAAEEYGIPVSQVLFDFELEMLRADPGLAAGYDPASIEYMTMVMTNSYPVDNVSDPELAEFNLALDPPLLYELEQAQIADINLDRMFPNVDDPLTDLRNYSLCMPASTETQRALHDSIYEVFQLRLPGWLLNPNVFADGTNDPVRAAQASTILRRYVES